MVKRRRGSDSDATRTSRRMDCNTVFVDTSLDTGLAMLVFESDTVADFKKKLVSEHKLCYPEMEIHIHHLEVKHRSRFYRLSDGMLVWSAFHGVKRSWYLWANASGTPSYQNFSGVGLVVSTKAMDVDNDCGDLCSDINRMQAIPTPLPDGGTEKNEVLDMVPYIEFGTSLEKTTDIQNCKETESPAKKKCKMRHTKNVSLDPCPKERDDLLHASSKDIVIPDMVVCATSSVDAVKEGINVVRNDGSVLNGRFAFEGTSVLGKENKSTLGSTVDTQNPTGSDERKNNTLLESTIILDNLMASQNEYKPGVDIQADYSGAAYVKVPDISDNSTLIKRKRKKAQETTVSIQDATEVKQVLKGNIIKPSIETHKSQEKEEETFLTLNREHEDEMPSSYKAGLTQKEASKIRIPSNKKKKIVKMSASTNLEKSDAEQSDNDISSGPSGLLCVPMHQRLVETDKEESTMDCQNPIGSDERKNDTFSESIIIPKNLVASKEYEPILDIQADTSEKRETDKETPNSLGDGHAAIPVVEKENQIVEFLQVEKHTENTVNTGKSSKKKRTSKTLTASDVQLKLRDSSALGVAHVGAEVSRADRNADFVMSTQTKQTLEADASGKREMHKAQNSPGDGHATFPVVEKENQIVEFLQVEKDTENTVNTGKSAKMKRKKKIVSKSDFQEDVQLKLMNSSTLDVARVGEQVLGADGNETDSVMSTQTKPALEADASGKRETNKETQNSPGSAPGNQILENLQVEKDTENLVNTGKSAKNKRKNKTLTASNVQEDLSVKSQNVGIGSSTEENSIKFVNSGVEGIHVASSQVISRKSKEKLEEKHEIALYTDDLARTTESEGEGVNFKQYFVPDHSQDKSGSHGKLKKPNQSDKDKKTLKKFRKNGLSSVNISTEVQSSKLSGDGERQNISCVRKDNGKRKGDSAQNSDRVEGIPNSSRSSRATKNWVQDSITSETLGTLSKKPKEFLAGSSLPKKKNTSLKKSSLERTEKFPEKRRNIMPHFGVYDTNRMGLKTPEKKSLLTIQGSIFQDNSGESSGDDNGSSHSSDSTQSPSDSSYTSDHSAGEIDSSLGSTRKGSGDAQVRSTGEKDTSKLDLSAKKGVTMKMILQSSSRYKNVKLLASQNKAYQNDSQPIEFVPDSQPS